MRQTVGDLITSGYLLLELQACLVDRYLIYSDRNDKNGMDAIEKLYYQLFGEGIADYIPGYKS